MNISQRAINDFKAACQGRVGNEMSEGDTREMAVRLLGLVDLLISGEEPDVARDGCTDDDRCRPN